MGTANPLALTTRRAVTDFLRFIMETPILTIDQDASVEDRLTHNTVANILPARYLQKDSDGNVAEEPSDLFERVAENVAEAEEQYAEGPTPDEAQNAFESAMKELRFTPNSPTLMNAGTEMNQLSACFVQEPRDDMENIFETAQAAALIFQSGGGVGYPFHHLRPKGGLISSTGGEASGPVSFMNVFDETCNQVKQGGKRRGAQMGILRVDHPDVGRFIVAKRREGELDNFNISVGITDEFVEAVEEGGLITLRDPDDYEKPFEAIGESEHFYDYEYRDNPEDAFGGDGETVDENLWRDYADGITARVNGEEVPLAEKWSYFIEVDEGEPLRLPAEFLYDMMIDGAHRNGEPGIFHFDEANKDNSFVRGETDYDIEATNPCAEQPLAEHESCNLGHVNLSLMVAEGAPTWTEFEGSYSEYIGRALDLGTFVETVQTGVRFLDNVVDKSDFPLDAIENRVGELRKIGVGVMGLAQMLYQMGVAYDSEDGREIAAQVLQFVNTEAAATSHRLASEREPFGAYDESKWAEPDEHPDWVEKHTGGIHPTQIEDGFPVRNHKQTTIAPTGTTSMIGDTSAGCEPVYSVAYYKNVGGDIQGDDVLAEFDSYFIRTLRENDIDVEAVKREATEQMEAGDFDGIEGLETVPDEFGDVFVTTEQITPEDHALVQRRLQEHVDSGISKTINLPAEATRDDVDEAYRLAMSTDAPGAPAKGITVYRDGSRDEQVKGTSKDIGGTDIKIIFERRPRYHPVGVSSSVTPLFIGLNKNNLAVYIEQLIELFSTATVCEICPTCGSNSGCNFFMDR